MNELAATAERLRTVKDAFQDFIILWALDRLMEHNKLSDHIHGDIVRFSENYEPAKLCLHHRRGLDD